MGFTTDDPRFSAKDDPRFRVQDTALGFHSRGAPGWSARRGGGAGVGPPPFNVSDILGYYDFDQPNLTLTTSQPESWIVDQSGNERTMRFANLTGTSVVDGLHGNAVRNSFISHVNSFLYPAIGSISWSVSGWYKYVPGSTPNGCIFRMSQQGNDRILFGFAGSAENPLFRIRTASGAFANILENTDCPLDISPGWHHVLAGIDKNTWERKIYIDGHLKVSQVRTFLLDTLESRDTSLGSVGSTRWPGDLDEICVIDTPPTDEVAAWMYNGGEGRSWPEIVAFAP